MFLNIIRQFFAAASFFFYLIRLTPCGIIILFSRSCKMLIAADLQRWTKICCDEELSTRMSKFYYFILLMGKHPEFRSLVYHRMGFRSTLIKFLFPPMQTLYIPTRNIGEGLFIQHGFSTIIAAEKIGKNCWINQQVTIGDKDKTDRPIIEDDVRICAGAKVIGKVRIGKGSVVGANAVIIKDIPPNCTVVGVPGYIVKKNGEKTREFL